MLAIAGTQSSFGHHVLCWGGQCHLAGRAGLIGWWVPFWVHACGCSCLSFGRLVSLAIAYLGDSSDTVAAAFPDIDSAKADLSTPSGPSHLKMIYEMGASGAKADPHTVGGQVQGAGSAGGFDTFWWVWTEINQMNAMCSTTCLI